MDNEPGINDRKTSLRIVEGAMRAMAKHGEDKVTIDDICAEAKLSKRTLYRYFQNRLEVIGAIADHIRSEMLNTLRQAILRDPSVENRVGLVIEILLTYAHRSETAQLAKAEPEFMRHSLQETYGEYLIFVQEAIAPVFVDRPDLAAAGFHVRDLAELIVRLCMEALLLPDHAKPELAQVLIRYWKIVNVSVRFSSIIHDR